MKRILFSLCVLIVSLGVQADDKSFKKAQEQAQLIQLDENYLFGMGDADNYADASRNALQDLLSKISVSMTSQIDIRTEEINENGNINSKNAMQAVINSYAHGTLNNTEAIQLSGEPQVRVMRYVLKSEIDKVFQSRVDRVRDYINDGMIAEKKGRIDNALRNFYWGFNLLKSVQHASDVTAKVDGREVRPLTWLPLHMEDVMSGITAQVANIEGNRAELLVNYEGKPVTSFTFSYYDGMSWSANTSVNAGAAEIEMRPGASMDNLKLRFEYEFRGEASRDQELYQVMNVFKSTPFRKASYTVRTATKKEMKETQKEFQAAVQAEAEAPNANAIEVKQQDSKVMGKSVERIVAAIKAKKFTDVQDCFTPEGYDMYQKLINYGQASLVGTPTFSFYPMQDKTICRGIPMKFSFKNNNRTFIETVTFTFNEDKKIESMAFALDKEARNDIFNKGISQLTGKTLWNDSIRMVMANFLENYKTAFALKRLDYIESIFDDNALIITGSVVKPAAKTRENEAYLNNKLVRYNKRTKSEYIESLRRCFASNQFINIRFADNDIRKMKTGKDQFGILVKQDYYSSNYSDTGYLFLLLDMHDPKQPIIKVRTWQPDRDPNLNITDDGKDILPRDDYYYGLYHGGKF
jgi:hypothetical protein